MEHWLIGLGVWASAHAGFFLTAIISIATAIGLGSIFTAVLSGKYQRDNTLRTMRSEWINALREDLAAFASYAHQYDKARAEQKKASSGSDRFYKIADDIAELRAQKNRLAHLVIMRLNPFEDDHIKLNIIVRSMNSGESISYRNLLRAQAQKVIKREWDVIRKGPMNEKKQKEWSADWDEKLLDRKAKFRRLKMEIRK